MKALKLFLLVLLSSTCFAQIPSLGVYKGDKNVQLEISKLDIQIEVVGNIATTTYDMVFYNPYPTILEGELAMPLKNGQEIYRYALEINGKLREGVIVEKVKARQAFEAIVRKNIDPGIINKTKGNNFKTKIYPIPAKGTKRLVLALSETLNGDKENLNYSLPFGELNQIDDFSLKVKVLKSNSDEIDIKSDFQNINFDSKENSYVLNLKEKNFKPTEDIRFTIPRYSTDSFQLFTCDFEGETYFYLNFPPNPLEKVTVKEPESIAIYWDNSFSASKRNTEKELKFLGEYMNSLNSEVKVSIYHFNLYESEGKSFLASNATDIISHIHSLKNDGATCLQNLNFSDDKDLILLFSDGVNTIGKAIIQATKPIYAISSTAGSDYGLLKSSCAKTNGEFIDLTTTSIPRALELIQQDEEKFLSSEYNSNHIKEVYPKLAESINSKFEITGILTHKEATLKVNFGNKTGVNQSKTFLIRKNGESQMVSRIWAGKKLAYLDANYEKNKERIIELSQKYNIITRNTSMLVLDRVEDYVRYDIIPPAELKKDYDKLIAIKNKNKPKQASKKDIEKKNIQRINTLFSNYDQSYKIKTGNNYYDSIIEFGENRRIQGRLIDFDTGEPVPFANVAIIDNETQIAGTSSDFNGNFSIESLPVLDSLTLTVSSVGYEPSTITISDGYPIQIRLWPSSLILEEAEVIAYELPLISRDVTSSGATVRTAISEDIEGGSVRGSRSGETVEHIDGVKVTGSETKSSIKVLAWMPDAPYMKELRKANDDDILMLYEQLKEENKNRPSFYIQVADLFFAKEKHQEALRILSNIIELDLENPELLKVVARRLLDEEEYEMAIDIYKEIRDLRPEEPQSFRDLAIAFERNKEYQNALEMYLFVLDNKWERFDDIKEVVFNEMNALISLHEEELKLSKVNKDYIKDMPFDIRITIDWSSNDNDIDLWVVDPNGEKCFYSHPLTALGGRISRDFTRGYGPEEFSLKEAKRGFYTVYVNYFSESRQTITGPVTVYAELTTHYGTKNQKTERVAVQLENKSTKGNMQIAMLEFVE
ncbi:DUF2135 domain-containing protein [Methanococcoides sp. SA1]|uniref:VIT domain-containing protein n=1 Tax=Lentimicrobium sp. L6 TaxID=2735916 RepID=UPI0015563642|nr:VIT domain-containing protein [Lentimicrobium sp. L6]NPD84826.1 DUF2135 domain-containing protein [Lentimicrobium sp. L6]NPE28836.1 DUF2135 domain-containing protein [Methanococcoides sp. SA1]